MHKDGYANTSHITNHTHHVTRKTEHGYFREGYLRSRMGEPGNEARITMH